ncbi:sensor histidine kinase [Pedobacter roseus]|uniref:histidine kinase n=1 Tax=Pedobacter roseus TaxID=336820 RepID=A0A7G9QLW3_9SPHI|nr:HAMP domain-containing sensor histidine kinase [Pedobacter roseus]QNN44338.1 HAMP domain-containing histidine kinase [Pedobacter roseus]
MHIDQAENNQHLNETLRVAKLTYYDILDTAAESAFDQLTQLAVAIFDVQHAGILFQAAEKVFVKSQIGSSSSNESVFYVSAPIITPDGFDIGKIYVADDQAREPTEKQFNMLKLLADMVMEKLESRIAIRKAFRAYDDRLHVLIHDLKNPMTTISLQSELLGRIPGVDERASTIAGKINAQAKRMIDNLNGILSTARKETNSFKPKKTEVDLKEILEGVKLDLDLNLKRKAQNISINIENPLKIFGDLDKLKVIFSELINNAVKFSPKGENIILSGQIAENEITITIKDHGVGLNAEDLDKIFLKFPRLSAAATENENVYGLGLITANALIEIHKGKLWVESEGKDLGTTFFVSLPIK